MRLNTQVYASYASTTVFILLWGCAAIFSRWGLDYASPLLLLICRFTVALILLAFIAFYRHRFFPEKQEIKPILYSGILMIGAYSIFYFQAMAHGVTPGLIATILGIQPILTLSLLERQMSRTKLIGLSIALGGLILLVWKSISAAHISILGIIFALMALLCITFGAIQQKKISQHPAQVLPLQYIISLVFCLLLLPFEQITFQFSGYFVAAVLFLGILISVVAQIILYKLLSQGNLVNVTSLFYLVPIVTALLDYLILGNQLPTAAIIGMFAIIAGIILVFHAKSSPPQQN